MTIVHICKICNKQVSGIQLQTCLEMIGEAYCSEHMPKRSNTVWKYPVSQEAISVHDLGRAGTAIMEAEYKKLLDEHASLRSELVSILDEFTPDGMVNLGNVINRLSALIEKMSGEK